MDGRFGVQVVDIPAQTSVYTDGDERGEGKKQELDGSSAVAVGVDEGIIPELRWSGNHLLQNYG